jgi:spoIIIJ-associated protein
MENELVVSASSVEEAIEEALEQLQANRDEVEIEILEQPEKKLFGGTTQAVVRVSLLTSSLEEDESESEDNEGSEEIEEVEAPNEAPEEELSEPKEKNYNEALKELTEEELDTIADTAIEVLRGFLAYFGAEEAQIEEYEGDEGELILDIVGDNLAVLIGRHGKTLDSLQFLVSSIVNKRLDFRHPIIVDVEGYKHRRKQKLVSIAKSSAARAIKQKHSVQLRPMTPYERRIVHVALKDDKRIVTNSEGTEPYRYVVIQPN